VVFSNRSEKRSVTALRALLGALRFWATERMALPSKLGCERSMAALRSGYPARRQGRSKGVRRGSAGILCDGGQQA
jgi:hypothetical protein